MQEMKKWLGIGGQPRRRHRVYAKPPKAKRLSDSESASDSRHHRSSADSKSKAQPPPKPTTNPILSTLNFGDDEESRAIEEDELWAPSAITAFKVLFSIRLCSAFWSASGDCDEVFNYWEPTHLLIYGRGLQTWEYSPEFAIRSYAYVGVHAAVGRIVANAIQSKVFVFFSIRIILGLFCAVSETLFYRSILRVYGVNVGRWTFAFTSLSSGMFLAGSAFLPSSFAMCCLMLAFSALHYARPLAALVMVAVAAIVAWPFTALLGLPVAVELAFRRFGPMQFTTRMIIVGSFISWLVWKIDSYAYGRNVLPPLNIILYNVFTQQGPNLYGTEPWFFYLKNGFLNLNLALPLALASGILIPLALVGVIHSPLAWRHVRRDLAWLPLVASWLNPLLWFALFSALAHKEERFLFPALPFLCWSAAMSLDLLQRWAAQWQQQQKSSVDKSAATTTATTAKQQQTQTQPHYTAATTRLVTALFVAYALISTSRMTALYRGYHAPIDTYMALMSEPAQLAIGRALPLQAESISGDVDDDDDDEINVCVGKEWHRFPSSFFLPSARWHVRFVRSDFLGLLPQPFANTGSGSSRFNATRQMPPLGTFNDLNRAVDSQYWPLDDCDFLVDLDVPDGAGPQSEREPRYALATERWQTLTSTRFLFAPLSPPLIRAFYVPLLSEAQCSYGAYVLLYNRESTREARREARRRLRRRRLLSSDDDDDDSSSSGGGDDAPILDDNLRQ